MTAMAALASIVHPAVVGLISLLSSTHTVLGAFIAHMSGADFFGLVVSVIVMIYLLYALIRGEKL
jgi:K+-transporting ATPase KdpF subunit